MDDNPFPDDMYSLDIGELSDDEHRSLIAFLEEVHFHPDDTIDDKLYDESDLRNMFILYNRGIVLIYSQDDGRFLTNIPLPDFMSLFSHRRRDVIRPIIRHIL